MGLLVADPVCLPKRKWLLWKDALAVEIPFPYVAACVADSYPT